MVASKSPERGTLARSSGAPHDLASLERATRIKAATLEQAIDRLLKIGWMALSGADPALSGADPAADNERESGARRVQKRPTRLTEEMLPDDWLLWARDEMKWHASRAQAEFSQLKDWAANAGTKGLKTDWMAFWRAWCRRADTQRPGTRSGSLFADPPQMPPTLVIEGRPER